MIGQMVSKYRILEEIGRGAMGIVFKAQDTVLGNFVALKILAEKLVNDPEMLRRFAREGGAASALNHPNISTVLETGSWRGRPYLAMELLTGQALDNRLAAGPIPTAQLIEIAIGVTGALEGANCRGPEKVARLRAALGVDVRLEAAYGDSDGDREMLALADDAGLRVFRQRP